MIKFKDEIEQFKRQNGNIKYSIKELLYGLNTKIDRIEHRLSDGDKLLASHSTWIKTFTMGFGIVFSVLAYLLFV